EADAALATGDYALVILDLGLPHLEGVEVLRRLRARGSTVPVIILTANDAVSSRVRGLDSGADDYLVKPSAVGALEARNRGQLRRSPRRFDAPRTVGRLSLDTETGGFAIDGNALSLARRERGVLEALIMRAGRPVAKDVLTENVFGLDDDA